MFDAILEPCDTLNSSDKCPEIIQWTVLKSASNLIFSSQFIAQYGYPTSCLIDEKFIVGTSMSNLVIFDLFGKFEAALLPEFNGAITTICITDSKKLIAYGTNHGNIYITNKKTILAHISAKEEPKLEKNDGHSVTSTILSLIFVDEKTLLSSDNEGSIFIHAILPLNFSSNWTSYRIFGRPCPPVRNCVYSMKAIRVKDVSMVAITTINKLFIAELTTKINVLYQEKKKRNHSCLDWRPRSDQNDETLLAYSCDDELTFHSFIDQNFVISAHMKHSSCILHIQWLSPSILYWVDVHKSIYMIQYPSMNIVHSTHLSQDVMAHDCYPSIDSEDCVQRLATSINQTRLFLLGFNQLKMASFVPWDFYLLKLFIFDASSAFQLLENWYNGRLLMPENGLPTQSIERKQCLRQFIKSNLSSVIPLLTTDMLWQAAIHTFSFMDLRPLVYEIYHPTMINIASFFDAIVTQCQSDSERWSIDPLFLDKMLDHYHQRREWNLLDSLILSINPSTIPAEKIIRLLSEYSLPIVVYTISAVSKDYVKPIQLLLEYDAIDLLLNYLECIFRDCYYPKGCLPETDRKNAKEEVFRQLFSTESWSVINRLLILHPSRACNLLSILFSEYAAFRQEVFSRLMLLMPDHVSLFHLLVHALQEYHLFLSDESSKVFLQCLFTAFIPKNSPSVMQFTQIMLKRILPEEKKLLADRLFQSEYYMAAEMLFEDVRDWKKVIDCYVNDPKRYQKVFDCIQIIIEKEICFSEILELQALLLEEVESYVKIEPGRYADLILQFGPTLKESIFKKSNGWVLCQLCVGFTWESTGKLRENAHEVLYSLGVKEYFSLLCHYCPERIVQALSWIEQLNMLNSHYSELSKIFKERQHIVGLFWIYIKEKDYDDALLYLQDYVEKELSAEQYQFMLKELDRLLMVIDPEQQAFFQGRVLSLAMKNHHLTQYQDTLLRSIQKVPYRTLQDALLAQGSHKEFLQLLDMLELQMRIWKSLVILSEQEQAKIVDSRHGHVETAIVFSKSQCKNETETITQYSQCIQSLSPPKMCPLVSDNIETNELD